MNRLSVLFALVLCFPLVAHADEASRRAKAAELITILHADHQVAQLIDNLLQQTATITRQRSGGTLTPETQAALIAFQKKLVAAAEPEIGWTAIKPQYVKLYADTFTDEDLDGILAFYKSPSGQALIEKMPPLSRETTQLLQSKVTILQPQLKQMFEEFEKTLSSIPPASSSPRPTSPSTPAPEKSTPQ
jgi:hypothetical protein